MISNLFNIGSKAVNNAQVSINTTSNNIANAETTGYQRADAVYDSTGNINVGGNSLGTGADIIAIQANWDSFIEDQYLAASADLAASKASSSYLSQMDSILNQSADDGLGTTQDAFLTSWAELSMYPNSSSEREALLGEAESLVYSLNSTSAELKKMQYTIEDEISEQVASANEYIDGIALLNEQISASPDNYELVASRDQMIRELDEIIGISEVVPSDGQVKIYTESGMPLVEGAETHNLVYTSARSTESLMPESTYTGDVNFSGSSSEELLLEFTSSGPDGSAKFKVSFDGGKTWAEDENGNTLIYTAGDVDNSVNIEGVDVYFSGGTTDHTEGDRYTIVPKSGLYWQGNDSSLINCTPMTDASGKDVSNRSTGGSLSGLLKVRDDELLPVMSNIDDMAAALIWEVNAVHSQGAGLTSHLALEGTYSFDDQAATLSNSGLTYADNIESGEFSIYTYDADGTVLSNASISINPSTDSLDDVVNAINTAFPGTLTASVDSEGFLKLQSATDVSFELADDSSGFLAAAGINTFFEGSDASDIGVNSYIQGDPSHVNCGEVGTDGLVSSGSNDTAKSINELMTKAITIGNETSSQVASLSEYLSGVVSGVGAAAATAETQIICDSSAAQLYYDQQASVSGVNVDEEMINLTRQQQQYEAACQIISVSRDMFDTILGMM
ncbi:flagellar hook-associated protein 1 FlgK [Maridesulfovibrio ferrireducens]|uniref:Flagellar hook-associated protein 1 n=1 Tax=Maridesulfovibrio ferrireducens TaxID=246191 RepID=A0A1G9JJ49_9BACT|nr:flagellar hook-associated protein FlgK [Maridesulfovibrio ferrireducens]SDL37312.1 flagellar hook-associated protein 1 FlgK [Maridesulfovibrio ferrireducens]